MAFVEIVAADGSPTSATIKIDGRPLDNVAFCKVELAAQKPNLCIVGFYPDAVEANVEAEVSEES